ncbi:MAG: translation elongation factor Ts [Gemmatimonadetes bacterium]|uniref:Elongation factor Ts n=1 Tax=Candidatus Kutchimonas denitrificans TaxID=3056748 RepID=A0AAE4ZAU8_9BACT|nr:translation elongation factor Ts [Gemmatimonadota bacterium]NIR76243.1 translation elongation factor Ts [Candidatus Kutchimonas denitrificans]NIS00683.1 translation elongation factor Ts [Gemmatimonadota bacterium]NIT66828.1 translation elongation factor Ts [Gemmatimonadota bacterium]NIV23427.1 translation elongation factor Ts [Gemmatimonadota bacterium]
MTEISAGIVKELRDRTGAGMMDCKRALQETDGDMEAAVAWLRKKGAAAAEKRVGKEASEGIISSYIHHSGKIGVMVELNCETDFVARTDDFQELARDLAMQIAASDPLAVSKDDVPAELVAKEREIYLDQAKEEGKPANIAEKIVEGRLRKFFEERTLLDQKYIKDPEKSVSDRIAETQAKLGEKIVVGRFARFKIGE